MTSWAWVQVLALCSYGSPGPLTLDTEPQFPQKESRDDDDTWKENCWVTVWEVWADVIGCLVPAGEQTAWFVFSLSPHLQPKRSLSHYFSVNFHCVYKFETWVFKNLFFLVDFLKIAKIVQRIPTYPVSPNVYIFPNVQRSNPGNRYRFNTINLNY